MTTENRIMRRAAEIEALERQLDEAHPDQYRAPKFRKCFDCGRLNPNRQPMNHVQYCIRCGNAV